MVTRAWWLLLLVASGCGPYLTWETPLSDALGPTAALLAQPQVRAAALGAAPPPQ